jgi:hypothetical protein
MGAFTGSPTGSLQYNQQTGVVQGGIMFLEHPRIRQFTYTHAAGAGTGEINLVNLPEGQFTIFSEFSRLAASAMVTLADFHLGYRAYTEPDGDVIPEDDNAFADNVDSGAAITHAAWPLPAAPGLTHINVGTNAPGVLPGFTIYATIDTGNIEDGDTIAGWVFWAGVN